MGLFLRLLSNTYIRVLIGLVTAVLLVLVYSKELLVAHLYPAGEFNVGQVPDKPDYTDVDYWVAFPDKLSPAILAPGDVLAVDNTLAEVDVFYIYPTTYFGPGGWNAELSSEQIAAVGIENMLATQASAFSGCCRIYAPQYRQAHIAAFVHRDSDSGFKALDLAYQDVEAAFKVFLQRYNSGRPFIIASHSQGTALAQRLLSSVVDKTPLRKRLVAAYLLGYWMPADMFGRNLNNIELCAETGQTGCVVTYDSYDIAGTGRQPDTGVPHWYKNGWQWSDNKNTVCVNPLSWRSDLARVSKQHNLGAVVKQSKASFIDLLLNRNPGNKYLALGAIEPVLTSAECLPDGSLQVDSQLNNAFSKPDMGADGSYHEFDWNFFYMNIRDNVNRRIASFKADAGTVQVVSAKVTAVTSLR